MRFNAEGPTGLLDRKPPGKPSLLKLEQRAALAKAVEDGPKPELHGVVRWRLGDLAGWLRDTFDVSLSRQTLGRELRRMGFRKLSARPRDHAQNPEALEAFKKTFPPSWRRSAPSCPRRPPSSSGGRTRRA
jgi:transposase